MINLSKSRYVTGLRCPKILWLDINKPELKTEQTNTFILDTGIKGGEFARSYFGEYALIQYNDNKSLMLEETKRLLAAAVPPMVICEASFANDGNFCSVDILKVTEGGVEIIEVKSGASEKPSYLDDMAYQYYVLHLCGCDVNRVSLMHINSKYERNGSLEIDKLFTLVDCTSEVIEKQKDIAANIARIRDAAGSVEEPACPIDHCCLDKHPVCPYKSWCLHELPANNIFELGDKPLPEKNKLKYFRKGIITFDALLASKEKISSAAKFIMEHDAKNMPPHVDANLINKFINDAKISFPVYHFDFESFREVIPSFDHQRPYQQIPFQYSLHIQTECFSPLEEGWNTEPRHIEFLGETGKDPRRLLAERLCADIPDNVCVLVYNQTFEKTVIKDLAALFPDLSAHLLRIRGNIRDLIVPFRKRAWYSRAQMGSNSLKDVVPAMFPNDPQLDYKVLSLIHHGAEVMDAFPQLPFKPPEEQEKIRAALLAYCRLDTLTMVKILQNLYSLSTFGKVNDEETS